MSAVPGRPGVGWTPGLVLANAFAVAGSGLALTGVLVWGWDAFQLLVLYWCETGIAAFWALAKLWFVPPEMLGTMVVNRKTLPATNGELWY